MGMAARGVKESGSPVSGDSAQVEVGRVAVADDDAAGQLRGHRRLAGKHAGGPIPVLELRTTATLVDDPRPAVVAVPPARTTFPEVTCNALRSGRVSENTVPLEPVVSKPASAIRLAACAEGGARSKPPRARTQAAARLRVSNTSRVSKRTVRILPAGP